jgi:spoIIIJ-associated protein
VSETDVETTADETVDAAPGDAGGAAGTGGDSLLVREGDIAADYLERLLDIADYDGDIDLDVENDRAVVAIVGTDLKALIGPRGETLDALQELTRLAVQQQTGNRSRLMLDVSGHRQARREHLRKLAAETAEQVQAGGEPVRMSPMNPFERKVVHDAIAAIDGVTSESEGEEPRRRVVVLPAR